ncbi:hypothetical protein FA15DRAFT_675869 [Coprinopsis marcescibilis]|uniref:Uncharacterized protein n=1 Tax=Coprinopsis marcescibilis TaxID=230819 RepID=A0A5C3KCD7_COPMA|nr:hypothetical protein FA15DRAFT_675869 [Coprinopsis marcescibilis]
MGPASPNISSLTLANFIAYVLANALWEIFDLDIRLEPFISFIRNLVNDGIQLLQPSHANHPQRQEQGLQWQHRPECATCGCRQQMDASMPPPYGTQDRDYEIPVRVTEPIEESLEPGGVSI